MWMTHAKTSQDMLHCRSARHDMRNCESHMICPFVVLDVQLWIYGWHTISPAVDENATPKGTTHNGWHMICPSFDDICYTPQRMPCYGWNTQYIVDDITGHVPLWMTHGMYVHRTVYTYTLLWTICIRHTTGYVPLEWGYAPLGMIFRTANGTWHVHWPFLMTRAKQGCYPGR